MRTYRFTQVDVFAEEPLSGNPLAVFPDATGLSTDEMQAIAAEMNLSETTFVSPPMSGGDVRVRIFTPVSELPFAGHPSVGTACEVVRLGVVPAAGSPVRVVLELDVGPTPVDVELVDDVPVAAAVHQGAARFGPVIPPKRAAAVLGLQPDEIGVLPPSGVIDTLQPTVVGTGLDYALIPVGDVDTLARVRPDHGLLPAFECEFAELYPFTFTGEEEPWVEARGLFPLEGIPEDPATGSAAGPLAAYLAAAGLLPAGATRIVMQGRHVRRPSLLSVTVAGRAAAVADVIVGGRVVPVIDGELRI